MEFNDTSIVTKLLKKVFLHTHLNKQQFTKEIIQSTMRVMADSAEQCNSKEVNEFAGFMTDQMVNMANKISGKQQGNRFSPQIIRIALSIWQRSKSAYEQVAQSNACMFPSVRQLARAKKENKMHQGFDLELYSRIHDEFVDTNEHKILGT